MKVAGTILHCTILEIFTKVIYTLKKIRYIK